MHGASSVHAGGRVTRGIRTFPGSRRHQGALRVSRWTANMGCDGPQRVEPATGLFLVTPGGNARGCVRMSARRAVHPRGCGERTRRPANTDQSAGSSPRVRGTRFVLVPELSQFPVHPRGCGERLAQTSGCYAVVGSSPRVRGTRFVLVPELSQFPVHPRGCGERLAQTSGCYAVVGSSPRVRGTRTAGYCHR